MRNLVLLLGMLLGCSACAANSESAANAPGGSTAVVQSGPQDIGEYRAIVAEGNIPALSVLDERGFFAEHKIDLPPADCGASVCVHPMLAVAPRFDGGHWAYAFVGMNTSVDSRSLNAQPRHLVLVLDAVFTPNVPLIPLLTDSFAESLGPEDRISVITRSGEVRVRVEAEPTQALDDAHEPGDAADGDPPLYAALAEALKLVEAHSENDFAQRVLVFGADANFAAGSDDASFYEALALEFAVHDTGITVFTNTPGKLPYLMAEASAGNYYFVQDSDDLADALAVEGKTAYVPLAKNLKLTLEAAEGYSIGEIYGAPRSYATKQQAVLESPVSYLGARTSSDDIDSGRRGGGGGWFVQLIAEQPPSDAEPVAAGAFSLSVEYDDAISGETVDTHTTIETPLGVGQNPPPREPYFSDQERGKPFMMLNMYLALATATMLANENQCGAALSIEPMMTQAWEIFTELYPDPDIDADFELLKDLSSNVRTNCREPAAQNFPTDVPMGCGYL